MRAAILSIGNELLRGDIVDTNAAYLARSLSNLGFEIVRIQAVGDDFLTLQETVAGLLSETDLLVTTGGLGPTGDDLTREAIAGALAEPLTVDEELVEEVRSRFASMHRTMPDSNRKQAYLIPSAQSVPNPNGTAPGWWVEKDGTRIVAMPGPPGEMIPMWNHLLPRIESLLPGAVAMRALMTWGVGESAVERRIRPAIDWDQRVTVATYAKQDGVQVHITARAGSESDSESLADEATRMVRETLGDAVFGIGEETLSEVVGRLLLQHGLTLATMESCTGGDLADLITNTDGSSQYFRGGVVAYTREAKARFGVEQTVMEQHGLISAETAEAMARAARSLLGSDLGIGVTGVAGDDPVEGKEPGTVYVAVSSSATSTSHVIHRPGGRRAIKRHAAQTALDLLRRQVS